jgi:formiminotetrahydrofolate cyclodeaminase
LNPDTWTLKSFLDALAAKQPTPGGGSSSALGGAIGTALGSMAANYTVGNEKYKDLDAGARAALAKLESLRAEFLQLMQADSAAYENYRAAVAMPKETPVEKAARKLTMAATLEHSSRVPELILSAAHEGLETVLALSAASNPNLAGDVASAAYFLEACARAASIQVLSNCAATDLSRCKSASDSVQACQALREKIHATVVAMICPSPSV